MDNNFIHPTANQPTVSSTVTNIGVQPYMPTVSAPAPPTAAQPAAQIGFMTAPAPLPVVPQPLPGAQSLGPQLAEVGIQPVAAPVKASRIPRAGRLALIFAAFMLVTITGAYLFNRGQQPIANNGQGNARGVVVPEQDLGSSVILQEIPSGQSEAPGVLIVNGDVRLQGSLNFNSGDFLGQIVQGNLTGNQTYTLPDESGDICLSSNNCNFLTGAQLVATGLVTADQLAAAQNTLVTASQLAALQSQVNGIVVTAPDFVGGSGISIVGETIQNTGVLTLNGQSGAVVLTGGSGILVSGSSISNNGVLTVNSQTGNVVFAAGSGIDLTGTTFSNTGVLSLAGQTGALNLVSGPGISIAGLTISNNGVTSTQGLTGNVVFTAGTGIDITGTAVSNTGVTLLTGTANQVSVSGGTGSVTLSLPQNIAATSTPTFGGLTLNGALTATTITSTSGLTVGATNQTLALQGSTTTISATNGANSTTLSFQSPSANVIYRFATAAAGTYDVCTTTGNCSGVGGGVTTPGGTSGTIPKFTSSQGIGDSLITDNGTKVTINGDFDVTGVINGQLVSPDAHFTGDVTIDLDLEVAGSLTVNTITPSGAMTVGDTGQSLLLQGSAVTLSNTSGGITNSLVFATPSGSNKTITLPNASGTVCLTSGNCAGVGGTGDVLQGGNSFGTAMAIGTNDTFSLGFKTNGATAMTILSGGNVGIGTTNPGVKFEVNGNTAAALAKIAQTDANGAYIVLKPLNGTNNSLIASNWVTGNGYLGFAAGNESTPQMILNQLGNVGIGTTSPGNKLVVADSTVGASATPLFVGQDNSWTSGEETRIDLGQAIPTQATLSRIANYYSGASSQWGLKFYTFNGSLNSTPSLTLDGAGNVAIGSATASAKLHVVGGNTLLDNTYGLQIRNNAATAINAISMDSSNHLTLGATSGMGNLNLSAGTGDINFNSSSGSAIAKISNAGYLRLLGIEDLSTTGAYLTLPVGSPQNSIAIRTRAAANAGLIIIGATSQTANLQEWQNVGGTVIGAVAADGTLVVGQNGTGRIETQYITYGGNSGPLIQLTGANGTVRVQNRSNVANVALTVLGMASQTGNLQEWQNSGGSSLVAVRASGALDSYISFNSYGLSYFEPTTAASNAIWVRGKASQNANLQEWQNNAGTILARVDKDGGVTTSATTGGFYSGSSWLFSAGAATNNFFAAQASNHIVLALRGAASQTGDLLRLQDNSATTLTRFANDGGLYVQGTNVASAFGASTAFAGAIVNINTTATGTTGLVVRGVASQTADLQQWQDSTGAVLAAMDASGRLGLGIAANSSYRLRLVSGSTVRFEGSGSISMSGGGSWVGSGNLLLAPTTDKSVIVRGDTSQTADLLQWQNSSSVVLAAIKADGTIYSGLGGGGNTGSILRTASGLSLDTLWSNFSGIGAGVYRNPGDGAFYASSGSTNPVSHLGQESGALVFRSGTSAGSSAAVTLSTLMAVTNVGQLQLNSGSTAGITLGGDTNLYRGASNQLKTDDDLVAGMSVAAYLGASQQVVIGNRGPSGQAAISFGSAEDVNLYRSAANILMTDDSLYAAAELRANFNGADQVRLWGNAGAATISLGSDVNLYRSAADLLRTDDSFYIGGGTGSEVRIGNTGVAGQFAIISNTRRQNYGDVLFGKNLAGVNSADTYRTTSTTSGGGYGGLEIRHTGIINLYASDASTTADGVITPTNVMTILGSNGKIGIGGVTTPSNAFELLASTSSTGGIGFGTDVNLYRSAADNLKTDDSFHAGADLIARSGAGTQVLIGSAGPGGQAGLVMTDTNLYRAATDVLATQDTFYARMGAASQISLGDKGPGSQAGISFGTAEDTNLYRSAASTLKTDDTLQSALNIYAQVGQATEVILGNVGPSSQAGIQLGADTNFYRSAADIIRTTDSLYVDSTVRTFTQFAASVGTTSNNGIAIWVTGDTFDRFNARGDGALWWGSGALTQDTNLYRSAADTLKTDDSLVVGGSLLLGGTTVGLRLNGGYIETAAGSSYGALWVRGSGSSEVYIAATGSRNDAVEFGSARDTNLYRSAANTLKTDDSFVVANTSATAFSVQTTGGTAALTADTSSNQIVLGSATNLVSTDAPTATLYTAASVGGLSLVQGSSNGTARGGIGLDEFGRTFYSASEYGGLAFIRCTNASCSSRTITDTGRGFINTSGASVIKVGSDGFARYAFLSSNTLTFMQCTDINCSTNNLTNSLDATSVDNDVDMALGSDTFARISYYDSSNQDLKFIQCTNASCSTRNTTTIDSTGNVGANSSVVMAADGFARIAYTDSTNQDLKFVQCTNAACSTSVITTIDSTGNIGLSTGAVVMAADGFARINYADTTNTDMKFAQCTNASCSTNVLTAAYTAATRSGPMAMGSDGFARIAATAGTFIQCTNVTCSTSSTGGGLGSADQMIMAADGKARIMSGDGWVKCPRDTCDSALGDFVFYTATGSTIGSNTNRMRQLYLTAYGINIGDPSIGNTNIAYNHSTDGLQIKNTTNSARAFEIQNASGTQLFTVDSTNSLLRTASLRPQTLAAKNNTITFIDSGSSGPVASVIGADGFSRLLYNSYGGGPLNFVQCLNTSCSSRTGSVLANVTYVSDKASMAIGSDGFARITYTDNGSVLKFVQCTNAACSTNVSTTVDGTTGTYSSVAMGLDGFARISYYDGINGDLKFVQCTNAACSTSTITTVNSTGDVGSLTAIAIGSDGFARIIYRDNTNSELEFVQCTNAACSTKNTVAFETGNIGYSDGRISFALGLDGYGRIGYYDSTNAVIKFTVCTDASCTSRTVTTVVTSGNDQRTTAMALGSDGFARISYIAPDNLSNLSIFQCLDVACTRKRAALVHTSTSGSNGYYPYIAVGSNGFARIFYAQSSFGGSYLLATLTSASGQDLISGTDIGSSSEYFGSAYIRYVTADGVTIRPSEDRSNALDIQNAAGSSMFTVDTANSNILFGDGMTLKSVSTPALVPTTTNTTVESTGSIGLFNSVKVASDTFARISYYDATNLDLKFTQCTNASCSTKSTSTVDSTGDVGIYTSMAIASDTFGRISYWDATNNDLKFVQCTNAACSTSTITTVDSTGNVGQYTSMALGSDGFARISYYDSTNQDLKFVQCTNASCSTKNTTTIDSTGNVGQSTSMALGSDGFARITYSDSTNTSLKFIQCTDAACSTRNTTTIVTGSPGSGSLALGSDGFARITYTLGGSLKFIRCYNADCSNKTTVNLITSTSIGANSITLGSDDIARISYYDASPQDLFFIHCTSLDCSTKYTATVDTTTAGSYNSIALGADGLARISYYGASNDLLINTPTSTGTYTQGVSIGTSSNYFANLYVGKIFAKNTTVTAFDLAENYHVQDTSIAAGDIVAMAGGTTVEKASTGGNTKMIGVVSTEPGVTLGHWDDDGTTRPVALSGRVPVKVTGPVAVGDYITLSDIPGVGKKATTPGMVVGQALTAFDGDGQGTVVLFVNLQYYTPSVEDLLQSSEGVDAPALDLQQNLNIGGDLNVSGAVTLASLKVIGDVEVEGALTATSATIKGNLTVAGHIITQGLAPAAVLGVTTDLQVEGNDTAGQISFTSSGGEVETGKLLEIVFHKAFSAGKKPRLQLTPGNKSAAQTQIYIDSASLSNLKFELWTPDDLPDGQTYIFNYFVVE